MAYNNNYKFTRPFTKDGKETKWHQVVEFIKSNGPVSRREILKTIWHYDESSLSFRGYQSSMFAQLNEIQPEGVHYDKHLKKWTTYGNNGNNDNKKKSRRVSLPVIVDMPVTLHLSNLSNKNYIKEIEEIIEMLEKSTTNLKNILKFIKSNIN